MAQAKLREPKRKYDEVDIADAAGVYIDHNGDLKKTKQKLGKKWLLADLRWFEHERHWPILLNRTQQRVDERIVEDAARRRTDQLVRLRNMRVRMYQQVIPPNGRQGVRAGSMEGCAKALVDIINMEREITGDKLSVNPPGAGIMIFLRDRILSEGKLAFDPRGTAGSTDGDSTDRFRF